MVVFSICFNGEDSLVRERRLPLIKHFLNWRKEDISLNDLIGVNSISWTPHIKNLTLMSVIATMLIINGSGVTIKRALHCI